MLQGTSPALGLEISGRDDSAGSLLVGGGATTELAFPVLEKAAPSPALWSGCCVAGWDEEVWGEASGNSRWTEQQPHLLPGRSLGVAVSHPNWLRPAGFSTSKNRTRLWVWSRGLA